MVRDIRFLLRRIWRADRGGVLWSALQLAVNILPLTLGALIFKLLIDAYTRQAPLRVLLLLTVGYALSEFAAGALASFINLRRREAMRMRVETALHAEILTRLEQADMARFDEPGFHDAVQKALDVADGQAMALFQQIYLLGYSLISFVIGLSVMTALSPLFLLFGALAGVIMYHSEIAREQARFSGNDALAPILRRAAYWKHLLFTRTTWPTCGNLAGCMRRSSANFRKQCGNDLPCPTKSTGSRRACPCLACGADAGRYAAALRLCCLGAGGRCDQHCRYNCADQRFPDGHGQPE